MSILHVQHGEVISDDAMNFAVELPPGIYEVGATSITGTGPWTVTVPVAPSGFTLWRDFGSVTHGRMAIYESGNLTFTVAPPSGSDVTNGYSRIDLLAGSHHWAASSPLGTMTAEMAPYYGTIAGTSGMTPSAPAIPSVFPIGWVAPAPGGAPVPLFQVTIPPTGLPTVAIYAPSDNRLANFGPLYAEIVAARSGAPSLLSRLTSIIAAMVPTGVVSAFTGAAAPTGYLLCNGAAVSRSVYGALFLVIGTLYGAGDGSTTFNVPNLQDKVILGASTSPSHPLGSTGGAETQTLTLLNTPPHSHYVMNTDSTDFASESVTNNMTTHPTYVVSCNSPSSGHDEAYVMMGTTTPANTGVSSTTGGDGGVADPFSILPPFMALNWIIKT